MSRNSEIRLIDDMQEYAGGYCNPVLLKDGTFNRLYRVSRAGKYFVIKTTKDDSGTILALLRREYELSIGLPHPHIITVFTFEEKTPVGPGMVMEYIDGCTLAEFLSRNPSRQMRCRVFEQLLSAVGYLHRKGIVHNDLKPENILVSKVDNTLKIIDFGLSDSDAYYLYKSLGCTPEYASPELMAQQQTDSRSDIYSLGMIMKDIFGSRFSSISSKASAINISDRYPNIDAFIKAFSRRNMIWCICTAFILLAIMIIPSTSLLRLHSQNDSLKVALDTLQGQYDEVSASFSDMISQQQRRKEQVDSVRKNIGNRMSEIYRPLDNLLKQKPFQEFAYREMYACLSKLPDIWKSFSRITSDQEMISVFMSHYSLLEKQYYEKYSALIKELPALALTTLPKEEFDFYYSLINDEKPYSRYEK